MHKFYLHNHLNKQNGYSFVEVLVSISILLVAIVGPMTIAANGIQNAIFAKEQTTAVFLAQEAIEGIYYLRNNDGLESISGGDSDTWSWVDTEIPSNCSNSQACRFDWETKQVYVCNSASDCDLYLSDSGNIRYTHHSSGNEETPFRRELYIEEVGDSELKVRSVVTWYSNAFAENRQVELVNYIKDIYAE